ncbi:MAG: RcnB family protein [Thermohalobaculum sp.]|nr:RcnB family protein [Thermohalobaculum sp.]
MRRISLGVAAGALALLVAGTALAGIVGLRPGGVGGLGPSAPQSLSPAPDRTRPERPHRPRPRHRREVLVVPFFHGDRRTRVERETVLVPVPAPTPEPEAAPPPPPDPHGAIRRLPARGAAPATAVPAAGAAIAPDVPLVILDWRVHALPEPPPGEIWVRLRGEVLRIDATSRVVRANGVAPAAAAAPAPD